MSLWCDRTAPITRVEKLFTYSGDDVPVVKTQLKTSPIATVTVVFKRYPCLFVTKAANVLTSEVIR